ncbi:MAG: hypothetical protein MJ100_02565 [Ruminococcus sp.]|nr:hypothetical protein [Ruminococcus sp.]
MEFEKTKGNFTFGAGSIKTAGKGSLSDAQEVPKSIKTKRDVKGIAVTAAKAAALTGLVLLKHKVSKKK